jgi:hypothetical protein
MWVVDKDTLDTFVEELKNGEANAAPEAVDLGSSEAEAPTKCEILFKTMTNPFSYVTLMTEKDKKMFEKDGEGHWVFKLTPI